MGVKFKDITTPKELNIKELNSKVVTIDASNIIYQFLSSVRQADGTPLKDLNGNITSHLNGILFQTASLIDLGIKPVYVFDGKAPELKHKTQQKRIEVKKKSKVEYEKAKQEGDNEKAKKYASRLVHLNNEIIESSKKLLSLMGVPFVQAPSEGEAQASYMVDKGDSWAVVSQDYDCLQFGATRMIRNLTITKKRNKSLQIITLEDTLNNLEITREQLVDIAIMSGTDFNEGLYNIGAKRGLKLIKKHQTLENVLKHLDKTLEVEPEILQNIFLKPDVTDDYKLKWNPPKKQKILDYLCGEHDFTEERTISAIKKIQNQTSQTSLEQWF
ncbi:MAG: flap endonuclease-1 [Methanobacteriaceae archaeon]|nr:flap endonuclease-1 [Methanobacteriaceae archaeon]